MDDRPLVSDLIAENASKIEALRELGATHIMISKSRFLKKEYPFLSDEQFERDFQAPMELLEDLLKMEATKIYEEKPTTIYRLSDT